MKDISYVNGLTRDEQELPFFSIFRFNVILLIITTSSTTVRLVEYQIITIFQLDKRCNANMLFLFH